LVSKVFGERGAQLDGVISYLNSDLDLISSNDLNALAAALEKGGVFPLGIRQGNDGQWWVTFETKKYHAEPEPNISAMLAVVETLPGALRLVWDNCKLREINIGYDCGAEPWAFSQGLSSALLGRMAAVGVSLRFTLYPDREPAQA
jgi:hypothetical protein